MQLFTAGDSQIVLGLGIVFVATPVTCAGVEAAASVEQWDIFEVALKGPTDGNPFVDVTFSARFTQGGVSKEVAGFYDGDGMYRVRFMPEQAGEWRYETKSNRAELNGKTGEFSVTKPAPKNHGPVRVANTFHFAYADGTPFKQIGTTCYAWIHQADALQEQTLKTLAAAPFNKLRMCVFPKRYAWNKNEPVYYPFEGTPPNKWDFHASIRSSFSTSKSESANCAISASRRTSFCSIPTTKGIGVSTAWARRPTTVICATSSRGSPRIATSGGRWPTNTISCKEKTEADWDRFFEIVQDSDPYGHLRSIHNGSRLYNHTLPWVTHASIQNGSAVEDSGRAVLYRDVYRKPVVFDEVKYEGNIDQRWGQLSAEEMVLRFWNGTVAGTYVGHGETYLDPQRRSLVVQGRRASRPKPGAPRVSEKSS